MRRILIENAEVEASACSYGFPWKYDATCYNFRAPKETVIASEIEKITDKDNVETLVIGCDLDDYRFIEDMVNLRQLYIYTGNKIQDTSFVRKLTNLSQLYIADSHIDSLDGLVELITEQKRRFDAETDFGKRLFLIIDAICIDSDKELDGTRLLEPGAYISEVIVNHKRVRKD